MAPTELSQTSFTSLMKEYIVYKETSGTVRRNISGLCFNSVNEIFLYSERCETVVFPFRDICHRAV